jgi:uncharacterized membrane protein
VDYQGLAAAQINALDFLNALAGQIGLSAGTYGQVLSSTVSVGAVLRAEIAALNAEGSVAGGQAAIGALGTLAGQISGSPAINVGALLNASVWNNAQVGSIDPATALGASLNVYRLTSFTAQIANGSHFVQAAQAVSIPGVATIDVGMTTIEPAQGSYYALGPVGLTVHTAQVRLQLTINLLSALSLGLSAAPVTLPVYVEVADGTATLQSIACGATPSGDTQVGVAAVSGVATASIGSVTPAAMTNVTAAVTPAPAVLVNVANLVKVTAAAAIAVQGSTQSLTFTQAEIDALASQSVSSTNMTSNLLQTLQSSMTLTSSPIPLPVVTPALTALLTPVFASLDGVTNQILSTLGVRVGYLDVTVTGDRCGVPGLIR